MEARSFTWMMRTHPGDRIGLDAQLAHLRFRDADSSSQKKLLTDGHIR
jgi:hypothetical protein